VDRDATSWVTRLTRSCVFTVQGSITEGDARSGTLLRSLGSLDHGDAPAPAWLLVHGQRGQVGQSVSSNPALILWGVLTRRANAPSGSTVRLRTS